MVNMKLGEHGGQERQGGSLQLQVEHAPPRPRTQDHAELVRKEVKLKDSEAQLRPARSLTVRRIRISIMSLPSFYMDMQARTGTAQIRRA